MTTADPGTNTALGLAVYVLYVIALWPVFRKAGYPGWGAIIPIYNFYVVVKIAGFSGWSILVYLIPVVNIFWSVWVGVRVAAAFGESWFFGFFLLCILSPIGYLIIGYGKDEFIGPGGDRHAQWS